MRTFLVIRFSAMGDVLLTLPVLVSAIDQNKDIRFVVLTRPKFAVFFEGYPQIEVFSANVDKDYKGILGLWKLAKILKQKYRFEAVIDLHQHIRTQILKLFLLPIKAYTLDKGRKEKKELSRRENKIRRPLLHASERCAQVLRELGLKVELERVENRNFFLNKPKIPFQKNSNWIGIAPFAKHKGKIWTLSKVKELIERIEKENPAVQIILFGGGDSEIKDLTSIANQYPNVKSLAGLYSISEELSIISQLDVMLCMDSSNMHMAALSGVRIVSVWGATHTDAGFSPYTSKENNQIIEIPFDELTCRPCSVYGNKPCFRKDYACLTGIKVESVYQALFPL